MKHYIKFLIILGIFSLAACEDFDLEDQGIVLEDLPGYVAFNGDGSSINLDTLDVNEDAGLDDDAFNIENPTGTLSDITVSFEFSGTAVFGTDFTVPNSTAAGGTIILDNDVSDVNFFNNVDFPITFLTDNAQDGEKILTITLTSAVNMDGDTFEVGRGGTETLRSATVRISDVD